MRGGATFGFALDSGRERILCGQRGRGEGGCQQDGEVEAHGIPWDRRSPLDAPEPPNVARKQTQSAKQTGRLAVLSSERYGYTRETPEAHRDSSGREVIDPLRRNVGFAFGA